MKLKKLTILGFKSFADKISLDFDCEVVGIVGPNGCGKSNIVDAFRWVLGEQSAKSLRGDKMHDVLFAGTDTRKPLNMAEVSVTLTDNEGELPIEYDEVTITRRLYRSGESEYLINRQQVRLKDVQNLFLGTGIGKNTFSVFEQGKLDQVINLSPMDRRGIFDEAAGIGRFLQRKKETLRKLSQVTDNYTRVNDVYQEVEKQTKQLKRQAAQAKNFQENKERLEELEKALLVTRWRTLSEKHHDLEMTLGTLGEEVKEEHHRLVAVEQNLETVKQELKEKEVRAKQERQRLHQAETDVQVQEAEMRQQKQRLVELEGKLEALKREKEGTENRRVSLLEQINLQKEALSKTAVDKTAAEQTLEAQRAAYEEAEQEMAALRKGLKEAREAHYKAMQEESTLERKLQEKRLAIQAAEQRLELLKERVEEKKALQVTLQSEQKTKKKAVNALSKEIESLGSFEEVLSEIGQEAAQREKALQEIGQKITGLRAREQALIRLKEACEGFSKSAKELMKAFKGKVKGLFEVVKPDEALMPALMKYAQTLVVSSKKELDEVLEYARKKGLSDFSIALFKKDHFVQLKDERVTEDGLYVDQKGVCFYYNPSHQEGNSFLREAELEELAAEISKLAKQQEKGQKALEKVVEKRALYEEKQRSSKEKRRKLEMTHVQENFALQRALADAEKCAKELQGIEEEFKKLTASLTQNEALESLSEALSTQQKSVQELLKAFKEHEQSVESKEKSLQAAMKQWQEAQSAYQHALSKWQQSQQQTALLEANEAQSARHITKVKKEREELKARISAVKASIEEREEQGHEREDRLAELEKVAALEDQSLEEDRLKRDELDKTLAEKRTKLGVLEKKRHNMEVAFVEDAAQRKNLETELLERHKFPPEMLPESQITLDCALEEAEQQVRSLRVALDRTGSVNMTAIEEYQTQAERFQELDRQLVDLEEAKNDLEKIITILDRDCRKIFKETFALVRENFRKNFAILFNGGEADLTFTESADVLEAGIEIVAKPPGKQMRSISLLSGGEKCLTALALLFSIFEVRPAPFCILDEVDAPLDDSNIDRFTAVLKQYIDKTQFIVVTHNKKTMSIADLLLGVSMEEKGISKLISLSFEKAALAEKS